MEDQWTPGFDGQRIKLDKLVGLDTVSDRLHVLIDPSVAEPECVVRVSTLRILCPE